MNEQSLIEEARTHAVEIIAQCVTPHRLRASALEAGYPQIWARDSILTFVGGAATGDPPIIRAGRASLETMNWRF